MFAPPVRYPAAVYGYGHDHHQAAHDEAEDTADDDDDDHVGCEGCAAVSTGCSLALDADVPAAAVADSAVIFTVFVFVYLSLSFE